MNLTTRESRAFTLIEMLVVIGVIAILMGILLPVISTSKEAGRVAFCGNNLSQIGKGLQLFADDHKDTLPSVYDTTGSWDANLISYLSQNTAVFRCPSDPFIDSSNTGKPRTYAVNGGNSANAAWTSPFGNYNRVTHGPARLSEMDFRNSDSRYATSDIIFVGERPGNAVSDRSYLGAQLYSGLDQKAGWFHKKNAGANYLMGSGAVRFYSTNEVSLANSRTNYWAVAEQ